MQTELTTCPREGCGSSPYPISTDFIDRCRKTGETFFCPQGHAAVCNGGKTADEQRIVRLNARIKSLQREKKVAVEWRDEELRRLERSCVWIECGFIAAGVMGLRAHMRMTHGMPTLAEVAEAS